MALVKTWRFGHVTVHMMDDAYRDASPAEIKRRIQNMFDVAAEVAHETQLRKEERINRKPILPNQNRRIS